MQELVDGMLKAIKRLRDGLTVSALRRCSLLCCAATAFASSLSAPRSSQQVCTPATLMCHRYSTSLTTRQQHGQVISQLRGRKASPTQPRRTQHCCSDRLVWCM